MENDLTARLGADLKTHLFNIGASSEGNSYLSAEEKEK